MGCAEPSRESWCIREATLLTARKKQHRLLTGLVSDCCENDELPEVCTDPCPGDRNCGETPTTFAHNESFFVEKIVVRANTRMIKYNAVMSGAPAYPPHKEARTHKQEQQHPQGQSLSWMENESRISPRVRVSSLRYRCFWEEKGKNLKKKNNETDALGHHIPARRTRSVSVDKPPPPEGGAHRRRPYTGTLISPPRLASAGVCTCDVGGMYG